LGKEVLEVKKHGEATQKIFEAKYYQDRDVALSYQHPKYCISIKLLIKKFELAPVPGTKGGCLKSLLFPQSR
jgi:hypothetical protein